jgi:hypothetical protein
MMRMAAKYYAIFLTLFYTLLFPIFLWMSIFSLEFIGSGKRPMSIGLMMVFTVFCIPLSMPASIYFAWSNFRRQKYKMTLWCGSLPAYLFIVAELLIDFIDPFF